MVYLDPKTGKAYKDKNAYLESKKGKKKKPPLTMTGGYTEPSGMYAQGAGLTVPSPFASPSISPTGAPLEIGEGGLISTPKGTKAEEKAKRLREAGLSYGEKMRRGYWGPNSIKGGEPVWVEEKTQEERDEETAQKAANLVENKLYWTLSGEAPKEGEKTKGKPTTGRARPAPKIETATKEDVVKAYTENIGREPTEAEISAHVGKTGKEHLYSWAEKQPREDKGKEEEITEKAREEESLAERLKNATPEEMREIYEEEGIPIPEGLATSDKSVQDKFMEKLSDLQDSITQATEDREEAAEEAKAERLAQQRAWEAAARKRINEEFGVLINEAKRKGESEVATARAKLTRMKGGLGADTATMGAMQMVREDAEARLSKLRAEKREAMARLDMQAAQRMGTIINENAEELDKLYKEAWNKKIDIIGLASDYKQQLRLQTQTDWSIMSNLKEGEEWTSPNTGVTYKGVKEPDPFFSSSDVVSMMKSIELGKTMTYMDPNTGEPHIIHGLAPKNANVDVLDYTNPSGDVSIVLYDKEKMKVEKIIEIPNIAKGYKPTKGDTIDKETKARLLIDGYLKRMAGNDGNVSSQTWNNAKAGWRADALNVDDFDAQFKGYINEEQIEEYEYGEVTGGF